MALNAWSKFYFDFEITADNLSICFDEGGGELIAQIREGIYSPTVGLLRAAESMNDVGSQSYSITMDRVTRFVTISATNPFDLLVSSGTALATSAFATLGFTGADRTGTNIYTGNLPIVSEYKPQFKLQDFVDSEHFKRAIDPSIRKTADGSIEVVKFGIEKFIQMNIRMATNLPMDGRVIRNNPNGVSDLVAFMDFITSKSEFEFMPDESNPNTFQTVLLERTSDDNNGTGYKLTELYDRNLPGFFETGRLILRVIE